MPDAEVAAVAVELPTMRVAYEEGGALDESELAPTWHEQLEKWLSDAVHAGLPEPNAMVLATANADGFPASRTVLAKDLDERGLVFFTNYTSSKSHDLMATRYASATFPWYPLHRQATVRGTVEKVSAAETKAYWAKRPRGAQLGAWASPQSIVVGGRHTLEAALAAVQRQFADLDEVPVPPHWGGWRIRPEAVEFWQGRQDRLHDRLRFRLDRETWKVERLGP
jgi:pyridoxamine 5'-phosphate oxidase